MVSLGRARIQHLCHNSPGKKSLRTRISVAVVVLPVAVVVPPVALLPLAVAVPPLAIVVLPVAVAVPCLRYNKLFVLTQYAY
jgi:hypothetical protein